MYLHQSVSLAASPQRVFDVLTSGAEFAAATEKPAILGATEGDTFKLFGGNIEGRNVELVPGKRLVQAWRIADWDAGVYSIVQITLTPNSEGTTLTLDQYGIPDGKSPFFATWQEHVTVGWQKYYYDSLRSYLAA